MGGGAAMRAAAKVAGINATIRGIPGVPTTENPFARKTGRPVSTFSSNPDAVKSPYWEMDDWEFVGGDEDLVGDPNKLLFGGAPTLKEAEMATLELKEAVNKAYLSPDTSTSIGCSSENMEIKGGIINVNTAPKQAIQAFHFLNENAAVQSVVASIASDPNVWNAVLQNEALVGFLHSQKNNSTAFKSGGSKSDAESKYESLTSDDELCQSEERNVIEDIVENMRVTVVEMMNSLSGYFQNIFRGTVAADGTEIPAAEKAMSASFMGLAVMVMMVVVLDRDGGVGISK